MKKITLSLFSIALVISGFGQQKDVLFIGNSYTYGNDLPTTLTSLAASFNDVVVTDQNTPGGHTFNGHSTNATTLAKIAQGTFDYVVLQAQSQEPSFPPSQVASQTYPYAQILVDSIRAANPCTEPMFFMTWGRENGDQVNCQFYPPLCTFAGMNYRLRQSYLEMAITNSATVAPVGVAWKNFRDNFPTVQLYTGDGSHPNVNGTYLAACVFYATIFQKSPIGATYIPAGINATDAANIQNTASYTVLDSLPLWRVNANLPVADFTFSGSGTINFNNTSTNGDTYSWDFGDGGSSNLQNPSHVFTTNGAFTVELITTSANNCASDTTEQIVNIATGIDEMGANKSIQLFPNPTKNLLKIITTKDIERLVLIDLTGKVVLEKGANVTQLNLSEMDSGVYFLKVHSKDKTIKTLKVIKE